MSSSLLLHEPSVPPPLDPSFRPAALGHRRYLCAVERAGGGVPLRIALVRDGGQVTHFATRLLPEDHPEAVENLNYAARLVKFLLWQRGGFEMHVAGPQTVANHIRAHYAPDGARAFDAEFMAGVYERPRFSVLHAEERDLPAEREAPSPLGGHENGCRIGLDAGGTDRKAAAVIDGKDVFSTEVVWHPKTESDAQYHVDGIEDSIRRAAQHLPRIDAIGVSSAGIYVDGQTRVASLFRRVPAAEFDEKIRTLYLDAAKRWGDVPIEVANDGDVTALAGAMSLGECPVLGLALGTSLAAGYVNHEGLITGWLNELAFVPVDYSDSAPVDVEWSQDRGVGSQYLSQDAVLRLAQRAGIEQDLGAPPGAQLVRVQELLASGDPRPLAVYRSVGVYLGYALLLYAAFYRLRHVLLLGRVTSGAGGQLLLEAARQVLVTEDPELASRITLHLPDEASRRVGQAVAAASLPRLG